MTLNFTTEDGLGGPDLHAQWSALVSADPHATIFQGPRYQRVWHDVLGTDEEVMVTAVRDDDELLAVVVESRVTDDAGTTWRFGGGIEVTDYLGPVITPQRRGEVLDAWLPSVLGQSDVDHFEFAGMAEDTGLPDALAGRIDVPGANVKRSRQDVCPVVSVADGFDAYLAALPGKLRQEQKRKARKLSRDLGEQVSLDQVEVADLESGLDTFFAMQADADSPKAGFFQRDIMGTFFATLADEFAGDDIFRLHILSVGDRPAAATISLVDDHRWGLYNSAFDPVLASFAPGMVLVTELIQEAGDQGLETFDLLRGDEPYKYRFGATDRVIERLDVIR